MKLYMVLQHIYLVLASSVICTLLGLVLGVVAYIFRKTAKPILLVADILQTIPTLAMLGLIMVFFGSSSTTVIIGLVLYSLLPVVRNTYIGLESVDPAVKEAAVGMGMNRSSRLFWVELPLAFPMIFTGIRIAVVTAIGVAVFGTFVGGGGLGRILYNGVRTQNMRLIVQGTVTLMAMAVIVDLFMGRFEKKHLRRNEAKK